MSLERFVGWLFGFIVGFGGVMIAALIAIAVICSVLEWLCELLESIL